jgi:uncharacterized membrane protein YgdD (TMEM256/DUF423 family)
MHWLRVAGIFGALAVVAGAFGAHWLSGRIPEPSLDAYRIGAQYHLIHAAVLLGLAIYGEATGRKITRQAGLLVLGMSLFSGSLYLLAATNIRSFGVITPLGGLLLIAAWCDIAFGLPRATSR